MRKESTAYADHMLDLFAEILHETIVMEPLRKVKADITPSLAQGLQFLFRHGVCSVRDIARGLSVTYPAASQLIERLVRKGLVTRRENERDRRLSEIRLTDEGHDLAAQIKVRRMAGMSRILNRMEPESRKGLIENLESFIAAAIDGEKGALRTCSHCGKDHMPECVINELYRAATGTPIEQL
jgi:DNA-binding MarR family transcriptional regulator